MAGVVVVDRIDGDVGVQRLFQRCDQRAHGTSWGSCVIE